jgi:plastocyanin
VLLFLGLVASSCGGDSSETAPGQSQVFGYDDKFAPDILKVDLGTEVEWRMEGDNPHNVFASDGSWESLLVMERGQTFSRTFTDPGVYPYFCSFHGTPEGNGMAGYIIVGDVPEYEKPQPDETEPVEAWTGNTVTVPTDYATIQGAVDAAQPGAMVFVEPGVYTEAVTVRTPSLTIRGADRNTTILDGEFERSNGLHVVAAAVAVENMTARNFVVNGFYWTGVTGYRASYLTAHNNGAYGIYAFDSVNGLFEHSYGSGNRDSAFYIGQCYPCNAVVTDVVSEANGLGFSGTNAGGDLYLVNSVYRDNMGGIVPNSLDSELLPPQREAYIGGNLVIDNNNADSPTKGLARLAWGEGIVTGGGIGNVVEKNLVVNTTDTGSSQRCCRTRTCTWQPTTSCETTPWQVPDLPTSSWSGPSQLATATRTTSTRRGQYQSGQRCTTPVADSTSPSPSTWREPFFSSEDRQMPSEMSLQVLTIASGQLPRHRTTCLMHEPPRAIPPIRSS